MNPRYSVVFFFEFMLMSFRASAGTSSVSSDTTHAICADITISIPLTARSCTTTTSNTTRTPVLVNPFTGNTVLPPSKTGTTILVSQLNISDPVASTAIILNPIPALFTGTTTGAPLILGSVNTDFTPITSPSPSPTATGMDIGPGNTNTFPISGLLPTSTPVLPDPFSSQATLSSTAKPLSVGSPVATFSATDIASTAIVASPPFPNTTSINANAVAPSSTDLRTTSSVASILRTDINIATWLIAFAVPAISMVL